MKTNDPVAITYSEAIEVLAKCEAAAVVLQQDLWFTVSGCDWIAKIYNVAERQVVSDTKALITKERISVARKNMKQGMV